MTVVGAWWILVCIVPAVLVVIGCEVLGVGGDGDYGVPEGCGVGCIALVGGVILGLLLWALRAQLVIGGAA